MLTTLKNVLKKADKGGYAVGAFNINNLEILRAVVDTAVEERSPVIVQTSEGAIAYAGMDYLVAMMRIAAKAPVPVVMHLDHGKDLAVVKKAIAAGYTSVMYDGSTLPFKDNVRNTKKVVAWAKKRGVSVEAEIGAISGVEDLVNVSEREAAFTDPDEAGRFVAATKCDALAISIGTAHGAMKSKASGDIALDIARLKKIDAAVKVPLVLHGASGVSEKLVSETKKYCESYEDCQRLSGAKGIPDDQITSAIKAGIRKINIDSDLRIAFTAGIRDALMEDKTAIDPRKHMKLPMKLMSEVVRHKMRLFGSAGKG
jgi:fructose-bisphosphate aldolase class II